MAEGLKIIDGRRLFQYLEIKDQHRQVIFNGGTRDLFMVNLEIGAVPLHDAITAYLAALKDAEGTYKYDFVIELDRSERPGGATTQPPKIIERPGDDASRRFAGISGPRQSVSPKRAGRNNVAPTDGGASTRAVTKPSTAAMAAADSIHALNSGDEKQMLGDLARMFKENEDIQFAVVYRYPDTMVADNDFKSYRSMLNSISTWAWLPNVASFLILDEKRQEQFNTWQDIEYNNDEVSLAVNLARPSREELAAFLKRVSCRHRLLCSDPDGIAATAAAEGKGLSDFATRLRNFIAEAPDDALLDNFYSDQDKVLSLEKVKTEIDALVGLDAVKAYVAARCKEIEDNDELAKAGKPRNRLQPLPHFMFLGNSGTGKTTVARLLGQLFLALGLRARNAFVEISLSDLAADSSQSPIEVMMKKINAAMGGVLFVDEVYLLAEDQGGRQALQALMKEMEDKRDSFTVIMASYAEKLPELYKVNPGFQSRIGQTINFQDYDTEQLTDMVKRMLEKAGLALPADAESRIRMYVESRQQRGGIGNGRGARTFFEKICRKVRERDPKAKEVLAQDVPEPMRLHAKEALACIKSFEEEFIGIPRVKAFMREMYKTQLAMEQRRQARMDAGEAPLNSNLQPNNCFYLGNPGTGKTTVARKMGELFYYLGLVSDNKPPKEVDPIQAFTSSYANEYAKRVKDVFDESLGGVLFIDEAYQLANDEQGRKVLDQIVKMTTEPRYLDMVIVMAGYPDEMLKLADSNPGVKRRFPNQVYFDDFGPDELMSIFKQEMEKEGLRIGGDEASFNAHLRAILARMATERHFGNAGAVINYFRTIVLGNQAERLAKSSQAGKLELLAEDLRKGSVVARPFAMIMEEMNKKLVGLKSVKAHLVAIANHIRVGRERASRLGAPMAAVSHHACFVGNSGTGKRTVAGYFAEILCSLGVVSQPKPRFWHGVDLKGSFVGQTKDKVNKLFDDCVDSVIVIDNIYAINAENASNQDTYGLEAIDALAAGLGDAKNGTTVVVLTGEEEKLTQFLAAFPQLGAYFGDAVRFPDYSNAECLEMLHRLLAAAKYEVPPADREKFDQRARAHLGKGGNAAAVQSVMHTIVRASDARIGALLDQGTVVTDEMLRQIDVDRDLSDFNVPLNGRSPAPNLDLNSSVEVVAEEV